MDMTSDTEKLYYDTENDIEIFVPIQENTKQTKRKKERKKERKKDALPL